MGFVPQSFVELPHQSLGGGIVDTPERCDSGCRTGYLNLRYPSMPSPPADSPNRFRRLRVLLNQRCLDQGPDLQRCHNTVVSLSDSRFFFALGWAVSFGNGWIGNLTSAIRTASANRTANRDCTPAKNGIERLDLIGPI